MSSVNTVVQFYKTVIEDVVNNMRETFLDDGVDEQVLLELKQIWENKLQQSKAVPAEIVRVEPEKTSHSRGGAAAAHAAATAAAAASAAAVAAATTAAAVNLASTHTAVTAPQQVTTAASAVTQPQIQYRYATAGQGAGGQKPMTFTLPQGVTMGPGQTFTLPAHLMQHATNAGGLVMSSSANAAAQALPANMAASLLQSAMTINSSGMITQQQGDRMVSYQTVTADQLAKQGFMVSMAPGVAGQTLQVAGAPAGHHLHPAQVSSESDNGTAKMVHFLSSKPGGIVQLDGANDTTDEDDDDDDLQDDDLDDDEQNEEEEVVGEEEDPLNSEDDVSDDDPSELFDTDNVIVCQYDKITRSRNKWKFHLKDGIMNVQGKDYVFQKACGDAEW